MHSVRARSTAGLVERGAGASLPTRSATLGAECVPAQPVLCYNEGRLVEGTTNGTASLPAPSERPTTSWGR